MVWIGPAQIKSLRQSSGAKTKFIPDLSVSYQELAAKLSLVPFRRSEWMNVLQHYGLRICAAEAMADKLKTGWILIVFVAFREWNAEDYNYLNAGIYPRNAIMQTLDEITYIPGVNQQLLLY